MKQKETLLTTPLSEQKIELSHLIMEEMGDEHKASSVDTPLRADAFDKTESTHTPKKLKEESPY